MHGEPDWAPVWGRQGSLVRLALAAGRPLIGCIRISNLVGKKRADLIEQRKNRVGLETQSRIIHTAGED